MSDVQPEPQVPFSAEQEDWDWGAKDLDSLTEGPGEGHVQERVMGKEAKVLIHQVFSWEAGQLM